jgi:MFS family permease
MVFMPLIRASGRAVGTALRGTRRLTRGTASSGRWMRRGMVRIRDRGAAGEAGMKRLLDLHAASYAGDALITIGLAGTIFFSAAASEARSNVALYLLVTMVPFAVLAPVVGPLLDNFRHGRRYALAATMLGRAFLAWLISDYIHDFGLYPAAFGVLALSRAYGVARSAAVPRLLPAKMGLSEANARASVYGTIAATAVAPIGVAAFQLGPQWPLRIASVIFLIGMVSALRLPPRADSDPPEAVPRLFRLGLLRRVRNGEKVLSGRQVTAAVIGSASFRAIYGFLLLFGAFALKSGELRTDLLGMHVNTGFALGLVGGALAIGAFLASAVGARLRIQRPAALQAGWLIVVSVVGLLATLRFTLLMVSLLALVVAVGNGLSKIAADAAIQERVKERVRASAFAHSETILMIAWVTGSGLGLIPIHGRLGIGVAAGFAVLAAARAVIVAGRLRHEKLSGRSNADAEAAETTAARSAPPAPPRAPAPPPSAPAAPPAKSANPALDEDEPPPGFHIYRPTAPDPQGGSPSEAARPTRPEPGNR